jgi:hypothetical protein
VLCRSDQCALCRAEDCLVCGIEECVLDAEKGGILTISERGYHIPRSAYNQTRLLCFFQAQNSLLNELPLISPTFFQQSPSKIVDIQT